MKRRIRLLVFVASFALAFIYWRLMVFLKYNDGSVSFLRELTGLTIHHYHYGLLIILISALMLIFYEANWWSVGLMGFGLGSTFDSFISRLFSFSSDRIVEISNYNYSFIFTIFVFINIIELSIIFYLIGRSKK